MAAFSLIPCMCLVRITTCSIRWKRNPADPAEQLSAVSQPHDEVERPGDHLTGAILAGGKRGPAINPGNPAESLLVRAVEQTGELKMPPGRKLQPEEIASIRRWIELGAAWHNEEVASKPRGSDWWAFQPVKRVIPPPVEDRGWARNAIDQFILARLEQEHLKPSPEASKETLLRRVNLDLTGLPPSPRAGPRFHSRYER